MKQEVARRQLETAIELFFLEKDPVSIHVLAWSSSKILQDLCKHNDKPCFLDMIDTHIRENMRTEFRRQIKAPYNFFKHADKDPEEALQHFNSDINRSVIFTAVFDYYNLFGFGKLTSQLRAFLNWSAVCYPDTISEDYPLKQELHQVSNQWDISTEMGRYEFGRDLLRVG